MFDFDNTVSFQNRNNDLLTIGELLVDLISEEYEDSLQDSAYYKFFGGSPANIAMNVKRLGITPKIAAAVGNDRLGRFLLSRLSEANIESNLIEAVDYSTSMVLLNKSKSTPNPIFYRSADYHLRFTTQLHEELLSSKILHFSCWPISMKPARDTIEKMITIAKNNKILIGFDPNYHPILWPKGEDGVAYVKKMIEGVDIIKPSEDDAERLFGKDTPANQVRKFQELGAKLVILTMGKDGAIVSNGKETITFESYATEIVDTTGAGDAFWSGFYTSLVNGDTIREALFSGFAVSAYVLKSVGAIVDLPKLTTIQNLYKIRS